MRLYISRGVSFTYLQNTLSLSLSRQINSPAVPVHFTPTTQWPHLARVRLRVARKADLPLPRLRQIGV